jgi:hypothetical protein
MDMSTPAGDKRVSWRPFNSGEMMSVRMAQSSGTSIKIKLLALQQSPSTLVDSVALVWVAHRLNASPARRYRQYRCQEKKRFSKELIVYAVYSKM